MAIDPIYIPLGGVPEFAALGGESALGARSTGGSSAPHGRRRASTYAIVRRLKGRAFAAAFDRFLDAEWSRRHVAGPRSLAYIPRPGVVDRGLRAVPGDPRARAGPRWTDWPAALQRREPAAIDARAGARARGAVLPVPAVAADDRVARGPREATPRRGLFGDLPFMVDGDSADVWARQHQFRLDASVGVPPDAFSADGPGLGHAALPLGRHRRRATSGGCASARGAARISSTATASIISSASIAPIAWPQDGGEPFFTPGRRADADRARRAGAQHLP